MKTYCYKGNMCEPVETGAVQSIWYVCRGCGEEITESLYKTLKDREKDSYEEDERIAIQEEDGATDEQTDFWSI